MWGFLISLLTYPGRVLLFPSLDPQKQHLALLGISQPCQEWRWQSWTLPVDNPGSRPHSAPSRCVAPAELLQPSVCFLICGNQQCPFLATGSHWSSSRYIILVENLLFLLRFCEHLTSIICRSIGRFLEGAWTNTLENGWGWATLSVPAKWVQPSLSSWQGKNKTKKAPIELMSKIAWTETVFFQTQ